MQKRIKLNRLILLFIIIILFGIGLTALFYSTYIIKDVRVIPMNFRVSKGVGLNVDNDALHFGGAPPEGTSQRFMDISHRYKFPVKVQIIGYGDLAEWLSISPNDFILMKNETKQVSFVISVPKNATFGYYNGSVKVFFRRASIFG